MGEEAETPNFDARIDEFLAREVSGTETATLSLKDGGMLRAAMSRQDIEVEKPLDTPPTHSGEEDEQGARVVRHSTGVDGVYLESTIKKVEGQLAAVDRKLVKLGPEAEKAFREETGE